jgi:hypothetical protein
MGVVVEDFDEVGKLVHGFLVVDELDEVDNGDGGILQPTYISKNLTPEQKTKNCNVLKEFIICFAWQYMKMPGLDRSLVEHRLPIKGGVCLQLSSFVY